MIFYRLVKVQKYSERYKRNDIRQDDTNHKKLREPLAVGKKVFVLAGRLKKGVFYKSTTENKPFFNRHEIFFIGRIAFINNAYNYWISKTVYCKIINKRFLRQELFALKEQFIWKMDTIFIYTNNLTFDENQKFILNFSDGDVFKSVNFSKENDYYIMSMFCFIEVSNDITKLKQYNDIEKKSIIANPYVRNRIDHGFDPPEIEINFGNKTYQFEINKISRSKAVDVYNFYDCFLKRKRFVIVYSL